MADNQDLYSTLGLSKGSSDQEIKSAYRKKALQWHPDKHSGDKKKEAEEQFKKINQAYEILRDPQKRQMYDQYGSAAFQQGGPRAGGDPFGGFSGRQGPFTYTYTSGNVNFDDLFGGSDPFDIFEQFFGGASPDGRVRHRKPVYSVTLDFMDAVHGAEKEVSVEGKKRKIKIPAGVDDNMRIRFNDFDLLVQVRPDDKFKRQGQDIIVDQPVSFPTVALGGTVTVPTIDGNFSLKIRAGTQPGTLVRLRGQGIPYPRTNSRGDQYVRINVEVPQNLSRRQRELLEELERTQ